MPNQFGRTVRVSIGTRGGVLTQIDKLRITFDVTKEKGSTANKAEVTIYNLSEATIGTVENADDPILLLEVGYGGELEQLYIGDIGDDPGISTTQEGADRVTKIECESGAKNASTRTISRSYKAGTKQSDVLNDMIKGISDTVGEIKADIEKKFENGFSFSGLIKDGLDVITKDNDLDWSIDDDEITVLPVDGASDSDAILLTSNTGLIGTPQKTKEGVNFMALLNPRIKPGRATDVRSISVESIVVVEKASYKGDTHEGDFTVACESKAA